MKLMLMTAALALMAGSGCATASGGNAFAFGAIYSGYKSPGQVGTAQPGGISQIAFVDHEQFSVLGVYATSCTIVHGQ